MDKLKELLTMDPCYEQHIVSIKEIYEEHLLSILVPAMYEGFQSLYKRAYEIEQKFISASKRNPDVENPGILVLFQTLIKQLPNLNTHKIRMETDRIKSSTKSAEIFDDLVRAVCKSNIILLTYNVDHKRKNLLQTKYHENVIIHDFVHSCYIQSARVFYGCPELFYHKQEPIILNQNKRTCYKIIKDAVKEAIRLMLPMKEVLLEYIKNKYEQKEKPFVVFANNGQYPSQFNQGVFGNGDKNFVNDPNNLANLQGVPQDEYMTADQMIERDIERYKNSEHSLLEDSYTPNGETTYDTEDNTFGEDSSRVKQNDFSLLISSDSQSGGDDTTGSVKPNKDSLLDDISINNDKNTAGDSKMIEVDPKDKSEIRDTNAPDKSQQTNPQLGAVVGGADIKKTDSDKSLKLIDISGSISKKGAASTYFHETMPDIKKRVIEYKNSKKKASPEVNSTKGESKPVDKKEDTKKISTKENKEEDIKITRSNSHQSTNSVESLTSSSPRDKKPKDKKNTDKNVDNMVDELLKV